MFTLDTNAIIYHLKGESSMDSLLHTAFSNRTPVYISTITEAELFSFPSLSANEALQIETLLSTLEIIPLDSEIARLTGKVRRKYRINLADSAIAATALSTGSTLLTRNIKDFQSIPLLSMIKI